MRALVAGLGRFGGGAGALRYLVACGWEVRVSDSAPESAFADVVAAWAEHPEVSFHFGPEELSLLEGVDLLVPSPALPDDHLLLLEARRRGLRVAGEIELFLEHCPARVLAITGSNGKTTTAHLLCRMLEEAGHRARLAGNMGISLLPQLAEIRDSDWIVVELSSFQLARLDLDRLCGLQRRPRLRGAIVTSFAPNHLDRHRDLDDYAAAKARLFSLLPDGAPVVLEGESAAEKHWIESGLIRRLRRLRSRDDEALAHRLLEVSPHGVAARNAMQAARLARALDLCEEAHAIAVAKRFRPLEDRLEIIADDGQRRFVNDSKSTTPEATAAGVAAFRGDVHLIAGGYDKELDLEPLVDAARSCRSVRLIGATAPRLAESLADHRDCRRFETLDDLLDDLFRRVESGVVLLSPGHASYGLWRDYRARGEAFRRGVRQRLAGESPSKSENSRLESESETD
jgi:UDP-N-acetylmuramoylalanine--D-glutamate ligase